MLVERETEKTSNSKLHNQPHSTLWCRQGVTTTRNTAQLQYMQIVQTHNVFMDKIDNTFLLFIALVSSI